MCRIANSEVGLPASKSSTATNVSPNIVTESSEEKVELSRDDHTHLSDAVATMISQTLELPGTAGNQAVLAIQESTLSAADIGMQEKEEQSPQLLTLYSCLFLY